MIVTHTNTLNKIRLPNRLLVSNYFIAIFVIFFITLSSVPLASMQSHSDVFVSIPPGTSTPGCEATNECFIPYQVSVDVGSTVTWSNDDTAAHTVTSGTVPEGSNGIFDSNLVMAGQTFSHTFDGTGTFPYFCMVHPWMIGEVFVSGAVEPNVSFSNFRAADAFGNTISKAEVEQQIQFTANVKNNNPTNQPFAYYITILQIPDHEAWITGELSSQQSFSPSLSQIFDSPGTYTINAYLYADVSTKSVLGGPLTTTLVVSGGAEPDQISILTNDSYYYLGDTITVAGSVSPVDVSRPVTIQVFSFDNEMVATKQVAVSSNGKYSTEIVPGGKSWDANEGSFNIQGFYGDASSSTEIQYKASQEESGSQQQFGQAQQELPIDSQELGLEIYGIIGTVVAIGAGIGIFVMKRKKSDDESGQTDTVITSPPHSPIEPEPDYSLDDSKLRD